MRYILVAVLLCASCAPHLIALYDAETDQSLTAFEQRVDSYLIARQAKVETDPSFYIEAQSDLSVMETRCRSIARDTLTLGILHNMASQIAAVKTLDKPSTSAEFFKEAQSGLDADIQNALALELAKQR